MKGYSGGGSSPAEFPIKRKEVTEPVPLPRPAGKLPRERVRKVEDVSMRIPGVYAEKIQNIIDNGKLPYTNLPDFVRAAIREYVKKHHEEELV